MKRSKKIIIAGLGAALSLAGVACKQEGPGERAGKALDEAAENVQEGAQDLTKEDGPLEEAGEAADEAVDKAMQASEDAVN